MNDERITQLREMGTRRMPDDPAEMQEYVIELRESLLEALDAYSAIEDPIGGELGRAMFDRLKGLILERLNGRAKISDRMQLISLGVNLIRANGANVVCVDSRFELGTR